jgi:hypothetical protein
VAAAVASSVAIKIQVPFSPTLLFIVVLFLSSQERRVVRFVLFRFLLPIFILCRILCECFLVSFAIFDFAKLLS